MAKIVQTTDERVQALAEKCPDMKQALEELFPDAFPKVSHFRTGTMFRIKPEYLDSPNCYRAKSNFHVHRTPGEMMVEAKELVLLMHHNKSHEYRLIHVATGYSFSNKIYIRKHLGIEIPNEDLKYLEKYADGGTFSK